MTSLPLRLRSRLRDALSSPSTCCSPPVPGHHGFDAYLGHKFHYLHHAKFECNYGGALIPLDAVFGTYRRD